jgi:hypothetical protein|tara:strand:+ start:1576 stop:2175 length:600 start_codon:yes stop_codon:yes gene_type:complete
MPFFSDTGPDGFQPKRAFRFLVTFTELTDLTFMVKTAKKPSYALASTPHKILNHTFNFPNTVVWDPISITFIDAVDPNVGSKFYSALLNAGYLPPATSGDLLTGVTKVGALGALGEVRIKQLDGGGVLLPTGADPGEVMTRTALSTMVLEEWTLKNAFLNKVEFGSSLSYAEEGLVEVSVGITYDFATYSPKSTPYKSD